MTSLCRLSNTISPMAIFFSLFFLFLLIFFFLLFSLLLIFTFCSTPPTSIPHRSYIDPSWNQHPHNIDLTSTPKLKRRRRENKENREEEGKGGGGLSDMHDLHENQWTATDTMNRLQWIVKEAGNRTSTITIRVVSVTGELAPIPSKTWISQWKAFLAFVNQSNSKTFIDLED